MRQKFGKGAGTREGRVIERRKWRESEEGKGRKSCDKCQ